MYICVKFSPTNLNLGLCPIHPTNTYTCKVTNPLKITIINNLGEIGSHWLLSACPQIC